MGKTPERTALIAALNPIIATYLEQDGRLENIEDLADELALAAGAMVDAYAEAGISMAISTSADKQAAVRLAEALTPTIEQYFVARGVEDAKESAAKQAAIQSSVIVSHAELVANPPEYESTAEKGRSFF